MTDKMGVVLVGIGGYGGLYVDELLDRAERSGAVLKGVVDPFPENCRRIAEIRSRGIPVHPSLAAFYAASAAELAVISSPIQFHADDVCRALEHGSHVLCEKPAAALPQDVERMMAARDRAGRVVAIGYQWSYSRAVQALKRDVLAGRFGKPVRLKTIVLWPRGWQYYARSWAGRVQDPEGRWVLDSVAANATAHYLHNMLFLLGSETDRSAVPARIQAEVYRANDIENYDTAAFRIWTREGVPLLFLASHAITPEAVRQPEFVYAFEQAEIRYFAELGEGTGSIRAILADGSEINYGNPSDDDLLKFRSTVDAIRNGTDVACGLEAAVSHTFCMEAVHRAIPEVPVFPADWIVRDDEKRITFVKGLAGMCNRCYDEWRLPSEAGATWACKAADTRI